MKTIIYINDNKILLTMYTKFNLDNIFETLAPILNFRQNSVWTIK